MNTSHLQGIYIHAKRICISRVLTQNGETLLGYLIWKHNSEVTVKFKEIQYRETTSAA